MYNYRKKYIKYKKKYQSLLAGSFIGPPSPICRNSDVYSTYIVKGHGISNSDPFYIYEGVRIIYLVNYGDTCPISKDLDQELIDIYELQGGTLFEDRDSSEVLTSYGMNLSEMEYQTSDGGSYTLNPKIKIGRGYWGENGGTLVNDVTINFDNYPCNTTQIESHKNDCGIDCYYFRNNRGVRKGHNQIPREGLGYEGSRRLGSIKLSEIIERQGIGTYIVRACRSEQGELGSPPVMLRRQVTR